MKRVLVTALTMAAAVTLAAVPSEAQTGAKKPNILVVWGDDIGQSNISAYTRGMMGYRTPHIDRIANEGLIFTDYYGEQSCTAGRSSFITGQSVFRTGLSKVGLPGADLGLRVEDPTIAALLKGQGYATGQFGKNHLGDKDEFLPTNNGFDEFLGNKNHLDGYNILPLLTGQTEKSPRHEIFYFSDDGDLTALRYDDWKLIFMEQKAVGTFRVWMEPFVPLRVPLIFNLRRDPYERAEITSNTYFDWLIDRAYLLVPAQTYVGRFLQTFQEFPPRQKAASFSLDQVMEKLAPASH